ncbi:MAG: MtrB/PioB family outer membrane beta-barrel protein, partial [Elusimicrobiota bacterium]
MTRQIIRAGLAVSMAFILQGPSASEGGSTGGAASVADFGGRRSNVFGSKAKFGEYRDMRDGFLFNEFRLRTEGEEEPFFLDLRARNAARADESYKAQAGRYGSFKVGAAFDRTPHNYSEGKLILSGAGTGNLAISNQIQTNLEALEQTSCERYNAFNPGDGGCPAGAAAGAKVPNPTTDATGEDAAQQAIIRNLQSIADPTAFRVERERGSLSLDLNLNPEAKGWLKVNDERRTGARQIGAGTYERWFQGAAGLTHTSDKFFTSGMELAEPINYQTTAISAGAGVYKKAWSADFDYTFTDFHDRNTALIWANPFRATDAAATNMSTSTANNAFNRGRFAHGQLSLPPSAKSHDMTASGSVELPFNSRLTGSLGFGLVNQQDLLLPYTLNTGIAGVGGAPANVTTNAALPTSRFKGEVRTLTQSYVLSSKPTDRLSAKLKVRYYDYANRSDQILFPGYAAFGESYWRTTKNDVAGAKVINDVVSYNRQTTELGADYELAQPLTLSLDAFSDKWAYKNMRVDKTKEVGAGAGFAYHMGHSARLHGDYKFARRTVTGYLRGGQVI